MRKTTAGLLAVLAFVTGIGTGAAWTTGHALSNWTRSIETAALGAQATSANMRQVQQRLEWISDDVTGLRFRFEEFHDAIKAEREYFILHQ